MLACILRSRSRNNPLSRVNVEFRPGRAREFIAPLPRENERAHELLERPTERFARNPHLAQFAIIERPLAPGFLVGLLDVCCGIGAEQMPFDAPAEKPAK